MLFGGCGVAVLGGEVAKLVVRDGEVRIDLDYVFQSFTLGCTVAGFVESEGESVGEQCVLGGGSGGLAIESDGAGAVAGGQGSASLGVFAGSESIVGALFQFLLVKLELFLGCLRVP